MPQSMHIGIAGAGLLGRLLAWRLARAGHRVSVFDRAPGPSPMPRSLLPCRQECRAYTPDPALGSPVDASCPPTAAAFTAAGMLSPLAELDNAEPAVAALGWRSIALWQQLVPALPGSPGLAVRGSLLVAHRGDLGAAQRVLDRLTAAAATPEWKTASPPQGVQPLDAAALRALEPSVQGAAHAWLLPGEGQIDTVAAMRALHTGAAGVQWHWGARVLRVEDGALQLADGQTLKFDAVADVRGAGAKPRMPVRGENQEKHASPVFNVRGENQTKHASPIFNVRGVRGEVVWLHCPGHGLTRPVRLLHPRHRVYVVPRSTQDVLVGASEIESEDCSPVSLRTATELMAAAHSVLPALAEARILYLDSNLRPALPDNGPLVEHGQRLLRINGLFRHGWLLAPALVDRALRANGWAESGLA